MSLVRAIGGALQGFGAGVTNMAQAAKEREGEAYRRAYQERVFGLQQDQFAFNQEQAGITNELARDRLALDERRTDADIENDRARTALAREEHLADVSQQELENVKARFTTYDELTGQATTDPYAVDAYFAYKDQFGEVPSQFEIDMFMRSSGTPELRQFIRGQTFTADDIAQIVNTSFSDEPDKEDAWKRVRDRLKAGHAQVPSGAPPAGIFGGGVNPDAPTAPTPLPSSTAAQLGGNVTAQPTSEPSAPPAPPGIIGSIHGSGRVPDWGGAHGIASQPAAPAGEAGPAPGSGNIVDWGGAYGIGGQGGLVSSVSPSPQPAPAPAPTQTPQMDLSEIGLFLREDMEGDSAPAPDAQEQQLAGQEYSWDDIMSIAEAEPNRGRRGRGQIMREVRDKLAKMGAKVPSGNPPG